jgi:hypothetical protein
MFYYALSFNLSTYNEDEYVRLRLQHELSRVTCCAAAAAVCAGLNEVVPPHLLRVFTAGASAPQFSAQPQPYVSLNPLVCVWQTVLSPWFTAPELACLLGGTADISVAEWRQHTQYQGGYTQVGELLRTSTRPTFNQRITKPAGGTHMALT